MSHSTELQTVINNARLKGIYKSQPDNDSVNIEFSGAKIHVEARPDGLVFWFVRIDPNNDVTADSFFKSLVYNNAIVDAGSRNPREGHEYYIVSPRLFGKALPKATGRIITKV